MSYVLSMLAPGTLAPDGSDLVISSGWLEGAVNGEVLPIAPPHIHDEDDEIFICLSGALAVRIDDETVPVPTGSVAIVPRGAIHTWWVTSAEPANYAIVAPSRVHDLIATLHTSPMSRAEMEAVFRQHASRLLPDGS